MVNVKKKFISGTVNVIVHYLLIGGKKITLSLVPLLEFSMWGTMVVGRKIKVKIA